MIEHVAGLAAGRLSTVEITEIAERFLASDLVVRLTPSTTASGWEPARWSTVAQRNLEGKPDVVESGWLEVLNQDFRLCGRQSL